MMVLWQGLVLDHYLNPVPGSIFLENADLSYLAKYNVSHIQLSAIVEYKLPSQTQEKSYQEINGLYLLMPILGGQVAGIFKNDWTKGPSQKFMSCSWDQQSYTEATWAWVEDDHTTRRPCPSPDGKQVSASVQDQIEPDQANLIPYFYLQGGKT